MNFGRGATVELLLKHDPRTPDVPAEGPAATVAANGPQTDEAKKELATGQDLLFTKRDPRGSIPHFEQVTKAEPKYAPGYLLLATAALLSQDYAKAAIASQAAIQLDKDSAPAHLLHGMALEGSNDLDSAQRAFTKTLELNPESYEANIELGKVLLGRNDAKNAEKRLKKAAQLQPKAAITHALLGNAYLNQKNGDAALAEFKTAVQLDPQGALAAALKHKITTMEQAMQSKK
jgi:tetratricopeptide (TPR) repeat protein